MTSLKETTKYKTFEDLEIYKVAREFRKKIYSFEEIKWIYQVFAQM